MTAAPIHCIQYTGTETRTVDHVKLFWRCLFRCRCVCSFTALWRAMFLWLLLPFAACSVGRSIGRTIGAVLRSAGLREAVHSLCVYTFFGLCLESALSVRSSNGSRIVTERTIFDHFRTSHPQQTRKTSKSQNERLCSVKSKASDLRSSCVPSGAPIRLPSGQSVDQLKDVHRTNGARRWPTSCSPCVCAER